MSSKAVRAAIEGRLNTWAAARSPALRVAWENATFTPAAGETYLRAFLLPADTDSADLAGAHRAYRGVYQINITVPIATGSGAALGIAAEIDAQFPVNLRITAQSVTTQIITPASAGPALQGESSYVVPVSFQYRADTI